VKRPVVLLVSLLLFLPLVLITYRIVFLGYPPFPTAPQRAWQISMDARIEAEEDKEIMVKIGLPHSRAGQMVIEERITSGRLDFSLLSEGSNHIGVWSGTIGPRAEIISYRATILLSSQPPTKTPHPKVAAFPANMGKAEQDLAKRLVGKWMQLAPPERLQAIAAAATNVWGEPPPVDQALHEWSAVQQKFGRINAFLLLFRTAELPAQVSEGLWLTEGVTSIPITWIEVWTGKDWECMLPSNGNIYKGSTYLLPLTSGEVDAVRVSAGKLSEIRWTLNRQILSQWRSHSESIRRSGRLLDFWSLFRLPPEFQETFRILLLVPIGALMIGVLRNIIGFPTFGTFMPVLMALAFRNTGLIYGLGIFAGFVLIGYTARRSMERLRLLLVPRLSVILTLVIFCFTVLALIGSRFGRWELMAVGLLPFVILTMTIERFFVITEEAGAREGFRTAIGSALVASMTYGILNVETLQLTFFVYPELLFAVAAAQVLLGRYTGYRLSEFFRFRRFRSSS